MKLIVMVSGSGSNLQAIINAIADKHLSAEIILVVSNRKNAYGLERAQQAHIPTLYFPLKPYSDMGKTREAYDHDLAQALLPYEADWVVLAGWMHVFSEAFLGHFPRRVINLHPALPHIFDGTNAIERAYEAFQNGEITHSGCMVHYAIPQVDRGDVIVQTNVSIFEDDTLEDFATRMHQKEHAILVHALGLLGKHKP
jgi:formyltetrahydrofolate-dependent phosphoribosylglycinamide formyltransferase